MSLEQELELYRQKRPDWIRDGWLGRWVVIKGDNVLGPFDGIEAAVEAGYERFGMNEPFMARQVAEHDQVVTASRRAVHVPHQG